MPAPPSPRPLARQQAADHVRTLRWNALGELGTVTVDPDAIGGRTVAETVTAARDVPPHDYATMDGYAFATDDAGNGEPLLLGGRVAPADDPPALAPGEAVRVATGAPLPARADAVVTQEDAEFVDDVSSDRLLAPGLPAGTHVHPAGTTASEGGVLFVVGDRLAPRHAALLRDAGVERVTVHRPFSVGVLATGTEIHEGRQPDRDSDFVAGLLRCWGHEPTVLEAVPDDEGAVRSAIDDAAGDFDAVVTSGGTSVGGADHVVSVLGDHDVAFTGVALRPGRPITAATVAGTPVFALPGKPLAAHTAFVLVAAPFFAGDRPLATVPATPTVRVELPDLPSTDPPTPDPPTPDPPTSNPSTSNPPTPDASRTGPPESDPPDSVPPMEYAVPVVLDGDRAVPLGHESSSLALYTERFRPGRVSASTRTTLADGLIVTAEPLDPADPVHVVPYPVVE